MKFKKNTNKLVRFKGHKIKRNPERTPKLRYTISNPPTELFNLSIPIATFEVTDFHVSLGTKHKTINLFPVSPKDKLNESPLFGFLHYLNPFLADVNITLSRIKKANFKIPKPNSDVPIPKGWIDSVIIPKQQYSPHGWTTEINKDGILRKCPLFKTRQLDPLLLIQCSVYTYTAFVDSFMNIIRSLEWI